MHQGDKVAYKASHSHEDEAIVEWNLSFARKKRVRHLLWDDR